MRGDELAYAVEYTRRVGGFLLWRAGPPVGCSSHLAIGAADARRTFRFDLDGGTEGRGRGPYWVDHVRFRAWKEALPAESRKR